MRGACEGRSDEACDDRCIERSDRYCDEALRILCLLRLLPS